MHKSQEADIIRNIRSWHPVVQNDWWIKFSVYKDQVLLFVVSTMTGETIVRYFDDEDKACVFINWVVNQDSTKLANIKKST
jgi:Flp pilus assembly secretin CpaC